jgi:hypothetical protein
VLLQLLTTPLQGVLNTLADLLRVITNVLLPRALEGDLGADNGDKDTHAVPLGVDLVGLPVDAAIGDLSDYVVAGLGRKEGKVGE